MAGQPRKRAPRARKPVARAGAQPIAIAERGEHELALGGIIYRLRPSHAAIVAIEKKTERSLLALLRLGNTGDLSLTQVASCAAELIRAGAEDEMTRGVTSDRIGEMIFEEGVAGATAAVTLCLLDAATGGRDAAGNVKAAAA